MYPLDGLDEYNQCEYAGHEWLYAGGGLEVCAYCDLERDAPINDKYTPCEPETYDPF